jgi:hypothetical protein
MNTDALQSKSNLDVVFPEARTITIARQGATTPETIDIYPLPLQKWKKGFWYIAQVAPLLGFDLFGGAMSADEVKVASGAELFDKAEAIAEGKADAAALPVGAEPAIDTQVIYDALTGDGSDLILEFLAFAIDKDVSFFNGMYEEIVDIAVAVIELNLNFFVQKLLPKVLSSTKSVVATAQQVRNVKR